ncbi:2-phospho-L-lactate guanylyltransferase [Paraoerskovia sediminicola]|uniref:Phosphoenolpyruvate guanylyltransferase n=1 Tax=Paraoerskovia sediminicola TaxID=1138587 RepID=A0ABM8FYJ9_9CELL|nr:2-phospho-L-lactate guanylyltransferase [Paraoerskovia sediminicola]BDZ40717.1 2-phospho-L-lactate guanylyltransferase [Paraoerskovia sediminicola]BDZ43986.1 2-phospho-L-lactate guanylyltransferase [Paraoerskovia sediminicola]
MTDYATDRATDSSDATDSPRATDTPRWTVVVPVKRLTGAKSRLVDGLPGDPEGALRRGLARAFALDTLTAVLSAETVGAVVLVSSEPLVLDELRADPRVVVVPDPGGLTAAVVAGIERAATNRPDARCAVLLGDLPALTGGVLDETLGLAAAHPRAVVPDADGTGTTLLTGRTPSDLRPAFGPGSAAKHVAAGHVALERAPGRARRDVDTVLDLEAAVGLGVGPRTAHVLAGLAGRGMPGAPDGPGVRT